MCYSPHDRPPIPPMAGGSVAGSRLELHGADGNLYAAYEARAGTTPSKAAMLILPDVRGLHPFYEELALRFGEAGVDALAIDYFGRTAGNAPRDDDFPFMEHVTQTTWHGLAADISGGARYLAGQGTPGAGRPLFSIGFCFGGRLSYLCATLHEPPFTGVIGFYGLPLGASRADVPAPAERTHEMRGAVLGIFGGADQAIPPEAIRTFETALAREGVTHELVTYPDAPHSFFDRKAAEYAEASYDAWHRVLDFVQRRSA
ncbi:MAG: dienelactone hydrolase family protein [Candidatus Limnocylindrales bacterium]